ncbi:Neuroendocrine convertase 1 [Toxocara canis]|uniref:Neuroendocrine convertase 1 n=1 Tax=Toxocara canis TaxID=6265 RepID=A0A0B2VGR5_TOXCA|nr:Neuroendocrine convertase 1 [Toxocara canis]
MPTFDELNRHGTRCAGEVAMTPNNSFCGVGVAYGASIGGIRMLDGKITDRVEAEALSFNHDHIDIYSASWGPNDDGKTVEGPGRLAQAAILKGIRQGRNGKGAIYVWASGNGGLKDDDCDCDGYTDSVYTFSVSSAAEDGTFPWYGEKCASTLTSTYSTGSNNERMIMTTDIGNGCARDHSGTSASAPMAAGIIALALEANPSLTWRDVQHIAVWTAEPAPLLKNNDGWVKNAAGFYVNSRFGFGMMNALGFVTAAKDWINVPQQRICTTIFPTFTKRSISDTNGAIINFRTDGCEGQVNEINFLEHIQLVLDIAYPIRGHLSIFLVSPQGIRMLDGKITDRVEAEALSFNHDHIDIYSASWGPNDDGKTVEGPGRLAQAAILKGIRQGRNGKGAIYVWASGNGGLKDDDCDCDGYTDSVYTFSVSSAAEDGTFPWYGEKCASTLTSTYSTGSNNERMIMTTDIGNGCARDHSGTSASAPMAAGIIALALEANPSLTWRDVQHIAVWTAEPAPLLKNNDGWVKNAAGFYVNSRFGFGMMNALGFVTAAKDWINVPQQRICTTIFPTFTKRSISDTNGAIINFRTDGCEGQVNEINFLEHIQLVLDIAYPIRGHLSIFLVSPQGTRTQLLKVRREDKSPAGFRHWPFMSVHTWAESPKGLWQLEVDDKSGRTRGISGLINNITLIIYGTTEQPAHYKEPRGYDMHYNEVTDHRRSVDSHLNLWLERAKRMVDDKELQRPERVDYVLRYLDTVNQRRKRSTLQQYTISEFVSR